MDTQAKSRHPEKESGPDNLSGRKPSWIRVRVPARSEAKRFTDELLKSNSLTTVCEEANCPNLNECWDKKHATFLIMGGICTRACAFCNISTGKPLPLDPFEPLKLAQAVKNLQLKHTVITSVDRDDLDDGGAKHFASTIKEVRRVNPDTTIEILTPDFRNKDGALDIVLQNPPDVFNHNVEVVPRLYPTIRPGSRYFGSLQLLSNAKKAMPNLFTKSGFMLGFGESMEEIHQLLDDLRSANVDFVTIGQYLQPTLKHAKVVEYVRPERFETIATIARSKGFLMVASSPLTRSSYHAGDDFEKLRSLREKSIA